MIEDQVCQLILALVVDERFVIESLKQGGAYFEWTSSKE